MNIIIRIIVLCAVLGCSSCRQSDLLRKRIKNGRVTVESIDFRYGKDVIKITDREFLSILERRMDSINELIMIGYGGSEADTGSADVVFSDPYLLYKYAVFYASDKDKLLRIGFYVGEGDRSDLPLGVEIPYSEISNKGLLNFIKGRMLGVETEEAAGSEYSTMKMNDD